MAIFLIKNKFGEFKNIKPIKQDTQRSLIENYGHHMQDEWRPIDFEWDTEDGDKPRDIFLYLGHILIGNRGCIDALETLINSSKCECLPIKIAQDEYYIINVCDTLKGVLDRKKSKIEYFKDGSIKWIRNFAFCADCETSLIFHISEIASPIFATETFVQCVKNANLIGLQFEECKYVRSNFLRNIFK